MFATLIKTLRKLRLLYHPISYFLNGIIKTDQILQKTFMVNVYFNCLRVDTENAVFLKLLELRILLKIVYSRISASQNAC